MLINSLWSKLIVIRNILSMRFFKNLFINFSEEEKFKYVLFLSYNNTLSYKVYTLKNNGLSISSRFFSFYKIYIDSLLKMSFLPFVETDINKFFFASRPLKLYCDIPSELNKALLKDFNKSCCISFAFSTCMNSIVKIWLQKNFPFDFCTIEGLYDRFDKEGKFQNSESIYSVVFNFILNKMLWINY